MTGTDTKGALGFQQAVQLNRCKARCNDFLERLKALSARLRGQALTHYLKQAEPTSRHTAGVVALPLNRQTGAFCQAVTEVDGDGWNLL